ncbi:MAG: hypothetical protein NVS1B11_33220 [Terriglobales bacterium]
MSDKRKARNKTRVVEARWARAETFGTRQNENSAIVEAAKNSSLVMAESAIVPLAKGVYKK